MAWAEGRFPGNILARADKTEKRAPGLAASGQSTGRLTRSPHARVFGFWDQFALWLLQRAHLSLADDDRDARREREMLRMAPIKAEILKLSREVNAAILRGDREALERVYAPEFFIIHAYGYVDSTADHIEQLLARDSSDLLSLPTLAPPARLDVYGDVAVYQSPGETFGGTPALSTKIYAKKKNGRWQMVRSQSTEMQPERTAVRVDPAILDTYVGRYERGAGLFVVIAREGDVLVRMVPRLPKVALTAVSETQFFDRVGGEWTFYRGPTGRATHVSSRFRDREWQARRIE